MIACFRVWCGGARAFTWPQFLCHYVRGRLNLTITERGTNTRLCGLRQVFRNIPRSLKRLAEFKLGKAKFPLGCEVGVTDRIITIQVMHKDMCMRKS